MQSLILYLHSDDRIQPSVIEQGHLQQEPHQELAQLAEGKQVIVLVPSQDVLLTSVKLPKMNRSRLMQALPFALEEQVIGDVDSLHFVPLNIDENEKLAVAIVSKEKMQSWLNQLEVFHIQPNILIPAVLTLPLEENAWTIVLHDMAMVRMQEYEGFSCDVDNLNELLNIALNAALVKPHVINIHNYTHDALAAALNVSVSVKETFHDRHNFMSDIDLSSAANLLQGSYKSKKSRMPEMQKMGSAVMMLGVLWLVLLFLYPTISYFILKHRENEINNQVAQIYKRYFPQSASVVAPKLRMQDKLKQFSKGAGDTRVFIQMAYIGKGLREARGITLKRLTWQGTQMTLELSAASSENFSTFTDYLEREGIKIRHDSANLVGTRVNAVITME
jgi:general secretion pathway protein L